MRPHYTSTRIAKIKNTDKNKIRIGKDVEKLKPSYIDDKIVKWFNYFEKHFACSSKC